MVNFQEKNENNSLDQFQNRLKNRFIIEGSSLLGNKLEFSNFFEKDSKSSFEFTIVKILFERATLREASSFKSFLDKTIAEDNKSIIVDLNICEFVDSSFFGVLVAGVKRTKAMGKKFYIVYNNQNRLPIFSATGLDKVFKVFNSISEAEKA
ncbi:MAG: STAS domain-containing protein [Ignavibacteriales bacterium]|jgi:anti-sigma B factor antagonist|nr:STAS domain-containing protein [Ignavibacteriales bacterium]MBK7980301.1 STAS domain-containing protein [Ignavibacteriota bacterium]